jgi:hypothetical protein
MNSLAWHLKYINDPEKAAVYGALPPDVERADEASE